MPKFITKEGLQKIKEELEYLKTTKRKEMAERLRRAISFGDLSENFEYSSAKDDLSMMEQRIAELEDTVSSAQVVDTAGQHDSVRLGSKVELQTDSLNVSFEITDSQSANPVERKISIESPIGAALVGKKKGDLVTIETPGGKQKYKITDIS